MPVARDVAPWDIYQQKRIASHRSGRIPRHSLTKTLVPQQEQIDLYHEKYVQGLIELYNDNKKCVGMSRKNELRII